jgi:glycosyltransferase involved in cell wall biosynthesis
VQNPKVSVLMSVYNGESHLGEAVEGILKQTFTDFEFIIVDDGSTDSTWSILSEYATRDKRIVLLQNKNNIGLAQSLNKGLAMARGEYIARQDADDISLSVRFANQVEYLDKMISTLHCCQQHLEWSVGPYFSAVASIIQQ